MRSRVVAGVMLALALGAGCGSDDSENSTLTDGLADACERDCDKQAAPACERMPPNYATSCKLMCEGLRGNTPAECQAALRAQYQCALDRVTYSCVDGLARLEPVGACAREGAACAECRGSLCIPGL